MSSLDFSYHITNYPSQLNQLYTDRGELIPLYVYAKRMKLHPTTIVEHAKRRNIKLYKRDGINFIRLRDFIKIISKFEHGRFNKNEENMRRPWLDEDDNLILNGGHNIDELMALLKRTRNSIKIRRYILKRVDHSNEIKNYTKIKSICNKIGITSNQIHRAIKHNFKELNPIKFSGHVYLHNNNVEKLISMVTRYRYIKRKHCHVDIKLKSKTHYRKRVELKHGQQ